MWNMLKVNRRDCVSLLTTCNMPKTFFSIVFLVYYKHGLCLLWLNGLFSNNFEK